LNLLVEIYEVKKVGREIILCVLGDSTGIVDAEFSYDQKKYI